MVKIKLLCAVIHWEKIFDWMKENNLFERLFWFKQKIYMNYITFFYYRVIKCILLPPAGQMISFLDSQVEKNPYIDIFIWFEQIFYLVQRYFVWYLSSLSIIFVPSFLFFLTIKLFKFFSSWFHEYAVRNVTKFTKLLCYKGNVRFDDIYYVFE